MKEENRILNVLDQVDEKYIVEAAPGKRVQKKNSWLKLVRLRDFIPLKNSA